MMNVPPASFNMAAYVLAMAHRSPEKDALIVAGAQTERWSYSALEYRVRCVGTGLLNMGLRPDDRILMRLGNIVDFPVVYLAAIAVGLVPIPTSAQLTKPEVTRIAQQTAPSLIIADDGAILPDCDAPVMMSHQLDNFMLSPMCEYAMGDPNRAAYIIYTSGTSGYPRAVVHAHRAIWARRAMHQGWYGLTQNDRVLHAGAFNWTYTLGTGLLDPWTLGATAIVPEDGTPATVLSTFLAQYKATIFAAAPGIYRKMLIGELPPLPDLRHGLSAGEKMANGIKSAWQTATQTPVFEAFGMSECSTFISGSPNRPAPDGTIGYVQDGRRVAMMDEHGLVGNGDIGVICVNRAETGLMLGYLDATGDYDLPLKDGWFQTGDLASQTQDGAIVYKGRADDMMNAGGVRVSPIEIETVLAAHPEIQDVACCEVTVKTDVNVIAAFYTGDDVLVQSELAVFAKDRLAIYKRPRVYVQVDALPRGANNKLQRRQLRQNWEAEYGQT